MYKQAFFLTLQIATHLAYMVVLPIFVFGGLGLWLDRQLGTLPQYLLIGIGVAFVVTTLWLVKRLKNIIEKVSK